MNAIHAITFQSTMKRTVAGMLTGAVLSELAHPNGFGLGFSTTLQGARLENYMVLANNSKNSITVQVCVCVCVWVCACVCTSKEIQIALASLNSTNICSLDQFGGG